MRAEDKDQLLIAAYFDGELSPLETVEFEHRLERDPVLQERFDEMDALSRSIRRVLADVPVPPELGTRIAGRFRSVDVLPRRTARGSWLALAAALAAGIFVGGIVGYGWHGGYGATDTALVDAIYDGHLRALAAPQPFDIASSDRHVVKPWFNGRTTIAPDAPDLAPEGFPLVGGRVDIVKGVKVPTLVYRRRQHVISVTVLPRADNVSGLSARHAGSNIERWDNGDLSYFAISDLNAAELRQFVELFRSRMSAPSPKAPA